MTKQVNAIQGMKHLLKSVEEAKFLMSGSFRSRSERFLRAVTGDYSNTLTFAPGMVCTDGKKVWADPLSRMLEDLDLLQKIMGVRGQISHEAAHVLYTDFSSLKMLERTYGTGYRYFVSKDYLNIVEDSAIELALGTEFPGLAPYIRLLNDTAFKKLPSLQEAEKKGNRLKAHQIACMQYAIIGKVNGQFSDPVLTELFESAKPYLDEGRIARTTFDRMKASEAIVELVQDLIEESIQQGQQEQLQNPKGNDMQEGASGQARPMPSNKKDWRKAKEEDKEENEQNSSKSKSKKSDENSEEEDQSSEQADNSSSNQDEEEQEDTSGSLDADSDEEDSDGEDASGTDSDSDDENNTDSDKDGEDSNGDTDADDSDSDSSENDEKEEHGDGESNQNDHPQQNGESYDDGEDNDDADSDHDDQLEEDLQNLQKELEKEVGDVLSDMEKEDMANQQSKKRETQVKEHLKNNVKYSHWHDGIQIFNHYKFDPQALKMQFKITQDEVKSLSRNLSRRLLNVLRYNDDAKLNGQTTGYLSQSQLYRRDGLIFSQKREKNDEADLAILVLVDESGSMGSHNRYRYAKQACTVLAEVCEQLKIPFAVIGHQARHRRKEVDHFHYITFEKPIKEQKPNLENIRPRHNTREGVALKYASEYLAQQPQKDKLLLVISDGAPGHDYGSGVFLGSKAQVDAALVVEEMEKKKGITTVGISIGEGEDEIAKIYKNFISIPKLDRLPQKLVTLMEKRILKH